jgi:hypothetical protein
MGECSDCWRLRQGTDYSVSVEAVLPLIDRLVTELGSNEALCTRIGVAKNQISAVRKQQRVRGKFVEKLKQLDDEIAKEKDQTRFRTMEPEVVAAEPLGHLLREFSKLWLLDRPLGFDFMGPQDYLAVKSGVSLKQVGRISNSENQFVALSQADGLLTAIGKQHMLMTGEIPIIANPSWSLEAYMAYMKNRGCI